MNVFRLTTRYSWENLLGITRTQCSRDTPTTATLLYATDRFNVRARPTYCVATIVNSNSIYHVYLRHVQQYKMEIRTGSSQYQKSNATLQKMSQI